MLRLVTLASPLAGYYCNEEISCQAQKAPAQVAYSDAIQQSLAPSNYWRDPLAYEQFVKSSLALALMNNERDYDEKKKDNFMSVDKIVMFGSEHDEVILPYLSSFFGFYENGNLKNIQKMQETDVYKKDLFGLKTMNEQGRLVSHLMVQFLHSEYIANETFVKQDLAKELTMKDGIPPERKLRTQDIIGISVGAVCFAILVIISIVVGIKIYKKKFNSGLQQVEIKQELTVAV